MEAKNEIQMEEVQTAWCLGAEFTQIPLISCKRRMDKALKSNERLYANRTVPATFKQASYDWQDVAVLNFGFVGIFDYQDRIVHHRQKSIMVSFQNIFEKTRLQKFLEI
ncbi:unnamed protein product [Gongylonema pulchrum]|uniref:PPM-type phosphatase domain-containing protein n=1 Tax=Gongylonema pulchrum TaxID=637853 RepID=A0A183DEA7_9BILA|nr:unnamed protein product [Gongylonema pulchrum]